jgi:hypothetical protein
MLIVSRQEQKDRMAVCRTCPHLEDGFCGGKPQVGLRGVSLGKTLPDGTKLCGCYMAVKTRMKFAACPLGHWGQLSPSEVEDVRAALEVALRGVDRNNEAAVMDVYRKFIGNPPASLRCGSCLKSVVDELRSLI